MTGSFGSSLFRPKQPKDGVQQESSLHTTNAAFRMGLVHIPRVIVSLTKGFLKRRNNPNASSSGLIFDSPHVYHGRAGIFDVDYLGHLNNATYLTHAELARWEMTAYNGVLGSLIRNNANFLVASTSIRYRREIRPLWRCFQVETCVAGLDERNLWILHNFRYPIAGRNRTRAQMIVRGVVTQQRTVLDPRAFLRDMAGIDKDIVENLTMPNVVDNRIEEMLEKYVALEDSFREVAAVDDETHEGL